MDEVKEPQSEGATDNAPDKVMEEIIVEMEVDNVENETDKSATATSADAAKVEDGNQSVVVFETTEQAEAVIKLETGTTNEATTIPESTNTEATASIVDGKGEGNASAENGGACDSNANNADAEPKAATTDIIDGEGKVVVKIETGEDDKMEGKPPAPIPVEKVGVKRESEIKIESAEVKVKVEDDPYMVCDEADESDVDVDNDDGSSVGDETDEDDLPEIEQLRRANAKLNERLSILEEFIEVEYADKFEGFMKKRERLVDVMGLGSAHDKDRIKGERPSKSVELVGILKLVKDQASSSSSVSNGKQKQSGSGSNSRPTDDKKKSNRSSGSNFKQKNSPSKSESRKKVSSSTPKAIITSPAIRCHNCKEVGHIARNCPYAGGKPYRASDVVIAKPKPSTRNSRRREQRERRRAEHEANPELHNLRLRRRRISRAITRMQSKK